MAPGGLQAPLPFVAAIVAAFEASATRLSIALQALYAYLVELFAMHADRPSLSVCRFR